MRQTVLPLAMAAAMLVAAPAFAGTPTQTRDLAFQSNATGVCQAALPAFEGLVRKRPMAVQNEGTSTAFVTCSPVSLQGEQSATGGHGIWLVNNNASAVTVNCTAVSGARDGVADLSLTRSVTIAANDDSFIYWTPADGFDATNFDSFSTSCALAPGVGITTVYTNQILDVGM